MHDAMHYVLTTSWWSVSPYIMEAVGVFGTTKNESVQLSCSERSTGSGDDVAMHYEMPCAMQQVMHTVMRRSAGSGAMTL